MVELPVRSLAGLCGLLIRIADLKTHVKPRRLSVLSVYYQSFTKTYLSAADDGADDDSDEDAKREQTANAEASGSS